MRRHARSEKGVLLRKPNIGSGALSLSGPLGSMPSVETRRSTRIFLRKTASKISAVDSVSKGLRSRKRIAFSGAFGRNRDKEGDGWLRLFGGDSNGDGSGGASSDLRRWKREGERVSLIASDGVQEPILLHEDSDAGNRSPDLDICKPSVSMDPPINRKSFDVFYSRKRKSRSDEVRKEGKYGIVFTRKKRRKIPSLVTETEETSKVMIARADGRAELYLPVLAMEAGISEDEFWSGSGGVSIFVVLVDSSSPVASFCFTRFIVSILSWMISREIFRVGGLAGFLHSSSISRAFTQNGIFFLPLRSRSTNVFPTNALRSCGLSVIHSSKSFLPLISVDYSALALYFKNLHLRIAFDSMFLPRSLTQHWMGLCNYEDAFTVFLKQICSSDSDLDGDDLVLSLDHSSKGDELNSELKMPHQDGSNTIFLHSSKLRERKKKRSSKSRQSRNWHHSLRSHIGQFISARSAFRQNFHETHDIDVGFGGGKSTRKLRNLRSKNITIQAKESKTALSEVKQNIGSESCTVNILYSSSDRCWREEGAEVALELSESGSFNLAIKVGNSVRYLYKPQEKRLPVVVNRHTHAYVWTSEDGWKLEFCDKRDWSVFKELHSECHHRNLQVIPSKAIPVPGVREILFDENSEMILFVRPETYIVVPNDEVKRAFASSSVGYDMDSGDEEWLVELNSRYKDVAGTDGCHPMSDESFERIVCALEKYAYNHPDEFADKDMMLSSCLDFGEKTTLTVIYDYWLKKRDQKKCPLVRVFQAQPVRKPQGLQQPNLRKRRSVKRKSQSGRGKPAFYIQEGARREALHRVQEAETAARAAVDYAIELRRRAQVSIANADLAVFKSAMSLKIAVALRATASPEAASSLLD